MYNTINNNELCFILRLKTCLIEEPDELCEEEVLTRNAISIFVSLNIKVGKLSKKAEE